MPRRSPSRRAIPKPTAAPAAADDLLSRIRIPLIQRATITHTSGLEELFVIDLGLLGVFVERASTLPVGDSVSLTLPLPGNAIPIQALCRVAWWHPPGSALVNRQLPSGLGLEFVEISATDRSRVRQQIVEYLQRHPQLRRFHRQRAGSDGGTV